MNISSRTPEGDPYLCAICGGLVVTETSEPLGDSVCPRCGALLTRFRDGWGGQLGVDPKHIRFDTRLAELGIDSLDTVELVMDLEEDLDLAIPDEKARQMQTLADWIRWIRRGEEELGEQR